MKRHIFLALLLAAFATAAMAQKQNVKKTPAAPAAEKTYILTEQGVDVLVYGKKLKLQPPAGSIYDKFVKNYTNDYGVTFYTLRKKRKDIGRVAVSEGKIAGIHMSAPNVYTDNGINPGTKLVEALKKDGVKATMYYNFVEDYYAIDVFYEGIGLEGFVTELSAEGIKKQQLIEKETNKWVTDGNNGDQPTTTLGSDDFLETLTIGEIGYGIAY